MIHILPGMGADSSMFGGEWRLLEQCRFIDWPLYRGEQTLQDFAQRVIQLNGIGDGDVVVGHSLGGMIACEIAGMHQLRRLILISSATNKAEINRLLGWLHPLAKVTPFRLAQQLSGNFPGIIYKMFAHSDANFIRATCQAIFEWEGLQEQSVPLKRIHGRRDPIIPLPAHVDCILDGGHMLPLTHPQACVEFVQSCL